MNKRMSVDELKQLDKTLKQTIEDDKKYWRVNEVKCDAIYTAQTYEEFSDRVAAAHLTSITKKDKKNTKGTLWNKFSS